MQQRLAAVAPLLPSSDIPPALCVVKKSQLLNSWPFNIIFLFSYQYFQIFYRQMLPQSLGIDCLISLDNAARTHKNS